MAFDIIHDHIKNLKNEAEYLKQRFISTKKKKYQRAANKCLKEVKGLEKLLRDNEKSR